MPGQIPDRNFTHDGVIVNQSDTLEQYCEKVEKIKQYIREGHIFQTVLSQRWTIETKQTGFELYKELRELNPSPYLYYFNYGEFEVIGSSPEMIVKQQGSRVYTCPIAGTRRRGVDAEEVHCFGMNCSGMEKERAEHVMLVDLARNDMGRISEFRNRQGDTVYGSTELFPCNAHRIYGGRKEKRRISSAGSGFFVPSGRNAFWSTEDPRDGDYR